MRVSSAAFLELDDLVELWVELAADQRTSGSHLRAEANRTLVREALAQHVTADGILVVREGDVSNGSTEAGSSAEDADAGGPAGFVVFDIEAGAYKQGAARRMIRNLFVRPAYRDAGVGTRLLVVAEDALADVGVDAVVLNVLADNEATHRFYRRHGYRPHRVELEKSM